MMAVPLDPPLTINYLEHDERMRLVRSHRKLEAVLGAAPYYIEPTSRLDTTKASRREGRIFAGSPTSSPTLSMAERPSYFHPLKIVPNSKQRPRRIVELSRPLLLRLRSVPVPPSDNRAALLSPRISSLAPMTPISPTFTIDLERLQTSSSLKTRRRKMAKLTRTLGENIPPELVFPREKPIKSRSTEDTPILGPSSSSTKTPSLSTSNSAKPRPVISRPRAKSSRLRPKIPPVPSKPAPAPALVPTSIVHIHLPPLQTSSKPTIAERRRKPRPRSLSVSTGTDMYIAAAASAAVQAHFQVPSAKRSEDITSADITAPIVHTEVIAVRTNLDTYPKPQYLIVDEKATKDIFESYSPLPFQSIETVPLPRTQPQLHTKSKSASASTTSLSPSPPAPAQRNSGVLSAFPRFGKRKELGWSGEWNQDLGNVVKNLRNLKAR